MPRFLLHLLPVFALLSLAVVRGQEKPVFLAQSALRNAPAPSQRALPSGPAYYVHAAQGRDDYEGTKPRPWKTIQHALARLKPGDTLLLHGGVYYENVAVRLVGTAEAPITIRCVPGEKAVVDGSYREFFETPKSCWTYIGGGRGGTNTGVVDGEYRSTRAFPNLRNIVASFGDSMIGLNSYYHAKDLRATSEVIEPEPDGKDVKPLYCGPGVWYDEQSGYIHARFAPTHLEGIANYDGPTDPREMPLIVAPFRAVPLHLDGAKHVRLQDLVIRGGGYNTLLLEQCRDIELDNVTVWCGTYGVRCIGVQKFKMHSCGVYGSGPPWATRYEAGFNTYPGATQRDITRLNTHALLVADSNQEFEVYAFPFNDDWEISHCEFCDAGADGLYLGGVNLRFHHNLVENTRDDGLYLSPMYARHHYLRGGAKLEIFQNYFARCLTMLAFGGSEDTRDTIYFYRNIVDMRAPVQTGRPSAKNPKPVVNAGHVTGDHGSPPWPSMFSYHNTFVVAEPARSAEVWMSRGATQERPRRLFNNIFLHVERLPAYQLQDLPHLQADGNLYWQPGLEASQAATYFDKYRKSPAFQSSKSAYPPGFDAGAVVADPLFVKFDGAARATNDYGLQTGSPAINAGVAIPAEWHDPLREQDKDKPDIGALPSGAPAPKFGRSS